MSCLLVGLVTTVTAAMCLTSWNILESRPLKLVTYLFILHCIIIYIILFMLYFHLGVANYLQKYRSIRTGLKLIAFDSLFIKYKIVMVVLVR